MKKVYSSFTEAIASIKDGSTLMLGGFGLCGIPESILLELVKRNVKNLTIISYNCSIDDYGLGLLLKNRQIKKLIGSYIGENKEFERQVQSEELEVELLSQGALAEKIRAGGAGISVFYAPTDGKEKSYEEEKGRYFNGKKYVLKKSLRADFSIIRAWKGDRYGNLIYHKKARNFNSIMAAAGRVTIAQVEQLVESGQLADHQIHTPGTYVQTIIASTEKERIEELAFRK
jgi:3-oxoacid CoA-transferase subunit A